MKAAKLPLALFVSVLVACGSSSDEQAEPETGDELDVAESQALFGDDRVAAVLKTKPTAAPKTFAELEKLFGIGRACSRTDSKEIYVVEEAATRIDGTSTKASMILPRAVVTGCNKNPSDPNSKDSFSLMAALISDPDAPGAAKGDAMVLDQRLEVMALDQKTGLYNFYVFGADAPGSIKRVQRKPDGSVVEYAKLPKKKLVTQKSGEGCFTCHANGGPLMNEITEPWTNWVSTRKELPKEAVLSGETKAIVSEAKSLDGSSTRSSFANQLEKTIESGIAVWVEGDPAVPESGHGQETLAGFQPGGVKLLLKSAFCQTELNYKTAFDTMPVELFAEPDVVKAAGVAAVAVNASDVFPTLMPVRSEMDRRIQIFLQKKGFLTAPAAQAIRLVDDRNDVFSSARCGLWDLVVAKLPATPAPADVDKAVRAVLSQKADALVTEKTQNAYLKALAAATATSDPAVASARTAYFAVVKKRIEDEAKLLGTAAGRQTLKDRVAARKVAAAAMFPGNVSPLPLLE